MPRLPSLQDYGISPGPQATAGVTAVRGGAAAQEAAERAAAMSVRGAEDLGRVAQRFAEADMAINESQMAVERARALTDYSERGHAELRRLQTEGDLSSMQTTDAFGRFMGDQQRKLVEGHHGGPQSKAALAARLEATRSQILTEAGALGAKARSAKVASTLGQNLTRLSATAAQNPGSIADVWKSFDADLNDMAPALTPEQETEFRSVGRREIALSALNTYIARGNARAARDVMTNTPGLLDILPPEQQRSIEAKLIQAEQVQEAGLLAGRRKVDEARAILGHEPTMAQRVRLAGLADTQGEKTPAQKVAELEEVFGPLSTEQKARALNIAPREAKAPLFQDKPIAGDKIQRVVSYDNGATWTDFGAAYDRHDAGRPTDAQSAAALYAERMAAADIVLRQTEDQGTSRLGQVFETFGLNTAQSSDYQKFDQARRDFVTAILRRESGATITKQEFDTAAATYFPQPGDGDDVIRQKREARARAVAGVRRQAGPATQGARAGSGGASSSEAEVMGPPFIMQYDLNGKRLGPRYKVDLQGNIIERNE